MPFLCFGRKGRRRRSNGPKGEETKAQGEKIKERVGQTTMLITTVHKQVW